MELAVHEDEKVTRRSFLTYLIASAAAFIAATLGTSTAIFAASPLINQRRGARVSLGSVSGFQVGKPRVVEFSLSRRDGWVVEDAVKSVWVVRTSENAFITYSPRCTHLGCAVSWVPDQQAFKCPCHGGVFSIEGEVLSGPPPRPLDRLDNQIENGKLVVDYKEFRLGIPEKLEA